MASPLPVAHLSPPLSHTLSGSVSIARHDGGVLKAALGPIKFMAYFYNLPLCMRPPSHHIASALTVHTAVRFCLSPRFIAARSFEFFICSPRFLIPVRLLTHTHTHARAYPCTSTHMYIDTRVVHACSQMQTHKRTCIESKTEQKWCGNRLPL